MFFWVVHHICIALHAMYTHLAIQGTLPGKGTKREREKRTTKNPHHRWAYLAKTKCTLTEQIWWYFSYLFIYWIISPISFQQAVRGKNCQEWKVADVVRVDSNIRPIWRDTPLGLIAITHIRCVVKMKNRQWWHHTTSQFLLLVSSLSLFSGTT